MKRQSPLSYFGEVAEDRMWVVLAYVLVFLSFLGFLALLAYWRR